jgi:hypothetical protein
LNLIGVSIGEFGSGSKKTHMEAETTLINVIMKNQCFHFQGFDHFQAKNFKNGVVTLQDRNESE